MRTDYNCRGIVDFINVESQKSPRIYICASGAGAGIQNYLWEVPGCSKYFVGATFPYDTEQMDEFLSFKPEKYCSRNTAIEIAFESFYRAVDSTDVSNKNFNIGVGLTGVVASTREHRGGNRVFCSVVTNTDVHVFSTELKMAVGYHARRNDGDISNFLALYAIGKVLGYNFQEGDLELAKDFNHEIVSNDEALEMLLKRPYWDCSNKRFPKMESNWAIFPGAFNPPHQGHKEIAHEVQMKTGNFVLYSVSVDNPHKPKLLVGDVLKRSKMLKGEERIFTVGEPLYLNKTKNWPGKIFIIGTDAFERLLDPVWGPSTEEVLEAFKESETTFYISNRVMQGKQTTLDDIKKKYPILEKYSKRKNCFEVFCELETAIDISSYEVRNGTK